LDGFEGRINRTQYFSTFSFLLSCVIASARTLHAFGPLFVVSALISFFVLLMVFLLFLSFCFGLFFLPNFCLYSGALLQRIGMVDEINRTRIR